MKFKAHESFFIRKGWLSKGMKNIQKKSDLFTDKTENATDLLGLGSNMVKSLRYWLIATGLTEEVIENKKKVQKLTNFGKVVFKNDRFLEETGTLELLQYQLSKNKELATSWYFFFNEFNSLEFTKEDFIQEIKKYIADSGESVQESSLAGDFDCIINTYLPKYKIQEKETDPENNIDCPLGELRLIDIVRKRNGSTTYKKSNPLSSSFNKWIILAVINSCANGKKEIQLNELLTAPTNIGKTFNLDSILMLEILHNIEKSGELKIIRTSGLDIIQLEKSRTFDECVQNFYKESF